MTEPVRKQIVVRTSRERAFSVFTAGIDKWWPRTHHIGKSPMKRREQQTSERNARRRTSHHETMYTSRLPARASSA